MRTRREGEAELEVERASKEVGKMEAELERGRYRASCVTARRL